MVERIRHFIIKDHVEALMSLGAAWKQAFNDRVGDTNAVYQEEHRNIQILHASALSLKSLAIEATHGPDVGQRRDQRCRVVVAHEGHERQLYEMVCNMIQTMIAARRAKIHGETVKSATKMVDGGRKRSQEHQKRKEKTSSSRRQLRNALKTDCWKPEEEQLCDSGSTDQSGVRQAQGQTPVAEH